MFLPASAVVNNMKVKPLMKSSLDGAITKVMILKMHRNNCQYKKICLNTLTEKFAAASLKMYP